MDEPLPMICFTCTAGVAGVLSLGLSEDRPGKEKIAIEPKDSFLNSSEEKYNLAETTFSDVDGK